MKYKLLLTKKFFRDNMTGELSAQAIAQFQTRLIMNKIEHLVDDLVLENIDNERKAKLEEEAKVISVVDNAEDILCFLRKTTDPMNTDLLIETAMRFEDDILPTVIEMLKTTGNVVFIEKSVRYLSLCHSNPSEELMRIYDGMRSIYAQSMMLIVLGFRADEDAIPWVYGKYNELKKKDTQSDTYSQGALLALDELANRFGY